MVHPEEKQVIERVWRGRVSDDRAETYRDFLRDQFLPAAHRIPGYLGARVSRRRVGDQWEFMTITQFESRDAIHAFAGDDPERAHVAPEARALLAEWDERVAHFEPVFEDRPERSTDSP